MNPQSGQSYRNKKLSSQEIAELYQRTGALVLRRCRFLLKDSAEAEDVLQEVFVRVMRYGSSIKEQKVPLSWLYRTAERCCFDRLRRKTREPLDPTETPGNSLLVSDSTMQQEAAQMVTRFFDCLEPKLKQVALLHYVDGLPQERIAKELGWSRRTVGKKIKQLHIRAQKLAKKQGD